jgi:hypothetical protein
MHFRRILLCALPLLAAGVLDASPAAAQMATGEAVLRAMHDRYSGHWYQTLSFTQATTRRVRGDSLREETWMEYGAMPGRLRIEIGPREAGNGVIYAGDSVFVVRAGQVAVRRAQRNPLMILGFDVYVLPPEQSARLVREEGFPMTPVRRDSWNGRDVWVVGGAPGDLHSKQFWVDAERLVFVRSLEPAPGDSTKTMQIVFDDYRPLGRGWIAAKVEVTVDGQLVQREVYSNIRSDTALDASLFDPEKWAAAVHP